MMQQMVPIVALRFSWANAVNGFRRYSFCHRYNRPARVYFHLFLSFLRLDWIEKRH